MTVRNTRAGAAALLTTLAIGIGGCAGNAATVNETDALRAALQEAQARAEQAMQAAADAQATADQALQAATAAQSCCTANTDRLERAFKGSVAK